MVHFVWNFVPTVLFSFLFWAFHAVFMENENWETEVPEKMIAQEMKRWEKDELLRISDKSQEGS